MQAFRTTFPQRTCTIRKANYRDYKSYLANDFNHRCGYTDCKDYWFGGNNNFHIDHFIPWKGKANATALKCDYQNLVYCCSYVNIAKSNDEGPGKYLDPCNVDFNQHFYRDNTGQIWPNSKSSEAKYMHSKLKLFLKRYQLIWLLDQLEDRMQKLSRIIQSNNGADNESSILLADLVIEYQRYQNYLRTSL